MKLHICLLLLAPVPIALAQTAPAVPPLKMGLWQSEVTVEISGMPSGTGAPRTIVKQHCMTEESWKRSMQEMQGQQNNASCKMSNLQQDEHHLSFDENCTSQQTYTVAAHIDMHLDSEEEIHGTASMNMSGSGLPQGMSMKSTIRSKFVKSDCGDLKPGDQRDAPAPDGGTQGSY